MTDPHPVPGPIAGPGQLARAGRLGLVGLSLLAMVLALVVMGGPAVGRLEMRDAARIDDLNQLANFIACVARADGDRLPATLAADDRCMSEPPLHDRHTGQSYDYRIHAPGSYSLCATFERADSVWTQPGTNRLFDPRTGCLNVTLDNA